MRADNWRGMKCKTRSGRWAVSREGLDRKRENSGLPPPFPNSKMITFKGTILAYFVLVHIWAQIHFFTFPEWLLLIGMILFCNYWSIVLILNLSRLFTEPLFSQRETAIAERGGMSLARSFLLIRFERASIKEKCEKIGIVNRLVFVAFDNSILVTCSLKKCPIQLDFALIHRPDLPARHGAPKHKEWRILACLWNLKGPPCLRLLWNQALGQSLCRSVEWMATLNKRLGTEPLVGTWEMICYWLLITSLVPCPRSSGS